METPLLNPTLVSSFSPYTGPWNRALASHLLRRATFAPDEETIQEAIDLGLDGTIEQLFAELPMPSPPVYYDFESDPITPLGESWVDQPLSVVVGMPPAQFRSLTSWQMSLIHDEGMSIREKLTLFWHNHFATHTDLVRDARFPYRYITTLRAAAWGDFRQLTKDITIDPLMLRFLGGNVNIDISPNENYARELLELFTIGKGPIVEEGDYTNYTEDDIRAIARVLTGWRDGGYLNVSPDEPVRSYFAAFRHDEGDKQLSARFDNVVISNMGDQEYAHLIDIIFTKDEVARFICRKLYRWFVYYEINEDVEANIIQPMAEVLIMNDYEIRPAVEALLRSEHFFDKRVRGAMIRNPLDYIFTTIKPTSVAIPEDYTIRYALWYEIYDLTPKLGMPYFEAPDVAGWKAFYQAPLYYRTWISANTLKERSDFAQKILDTGINFMGNRLKIDTISWIATFNNPIDPNDLISEMTERLCPLPLTSGQKAALKEIIIPGLPDFEWTVEYTDYLSHPEDSNLESAIRNKLRDLLLTIFSMAEFHLS